MQSQRRGFCSRGDLLGILQIISEHEGELEASACDSPSHRSTACSGAGCLLAAGAGAGETPGYLSQPRLAMGRLESLGRAVRLSWPKSLTLAWDSQAACKAPVTRCRGTGRVTASFRHLIPAAGTALASRVCFITRAAIRPVLAKR